MDKIELPLSYCWLFLIQEKKEEFTFFREGSLEMCRVKEGKTIHPILRDAILLLTIPLKHYFPIEHPTSPSLLEISNFWRNTAGRGGTPPWARTIFNLLSIQPAGNFQPVDNFQLVDNFQPVDNFQLADNFQPADNFQLPLLHPTRGAPDNFQTPAQFKLTMASPFTKRWKFEFDFLALQITRSKLNMPSSKKSWYFLGI